MMALALTIAAQGQTETIDTSKFVVTYDYAVQTKMGKDDREFVDSCCVALMVGTRHTMQMEYYQYACLGPSCLTQNTTRLPRSHFWLFRSSLLHAACRCSCP